MRPVGDGRSSGERIVVVGAGIGGLSTALALQANDVEVVILERDPAPPELADANDAFTRWQRPGVPQFRHAHMFLARLQTVVRDRYPALHAELLEAGLELSALEELLPPGQVGTFRPLPSDEDLKHFWGRRATFEYVLRRHVGRLPHVRFIHSARVEGLLLDASERAVRVRGVRVHHARETDVIEADVVVDGSGKRTRCFAWLEADGARVRVERHPSNWQYVCRHYRLDEDQPAPTRMGTGANLDFFGYSTFYGEHGSYAITLGCPTDETEIARAMRRPEGFDAICEQVPVLTEWMRRSKVESHVLGAAGFENRWTHCRVRGQREILGFFPVGDSHLETNPIYGRGTTCAFVQSETLAEVLRATEDASERARRYHAETERLLRPHFDFAVRTDHMLQSRSKQSRGVPVPAGDVFLRRAFELAWIPAMNRSSLVAREMLKAMEMRELSPLRVRLAVLFHIFWYFLLALLQKQKSETPFAGPGRAAFLSRLPARAPEPASTTPPRRDPDRAA